MGCPDAKSLDINQPHTPTQSDPIIAKRIATATEMPWLPAVLERFGVF